MSNHNREPAPQIHETDHAMLVVWGQYAYCLGIPQGFATVPASQKTVDHSPQSKVLEFLVAHLGGLPYLKDLSRSAHPVDQDPAVAQAWGQPGWADHSGVSRTLSVLTEAEVAQYIAVLERTTQALIDGEVQPALAAGAVVLDGDLSPRPVSNGSRTYPEASYGHMRDRVQLGYQAAVLSMRSPTYGRLGLSAGRHTGKTVSLTQAEALALEAERRLGRRPLRRTDLLEQRLAQRQPEAHRRQQQVAEAAYRLAAAEAEREQVAAALAQAQAELAEQETAYQARQRPERPYSQLAKARHKAALYQRRLELRQRRVLQAQDWLTHQQERLAEWDAETADLQRRLARFQVDNATNAHPLPAILRLDAGFGTPNHVALLIEMGYAVYTKPYGTWLSGLLARLSADRAAAWQRVGQNAEMLAWPAVTVEDFPYPLDLGYERFWQGQADGAPKLAYSGLLHFGPQRVTEDLAGWFHDYNARQTIEAGNKEGQQVFEVQHIKVRALPAMRLQEYFALFAANFVRFAAHWLAEQCPQVPNGWQVSQSPKVKEQVKVGAHSPARIEWYGNDCLVRFEERSVYAGRSFLVRRQVAIQLTLGI